jgi:hypothetical protein
MTSLRRRAASSLALADLQQVFRHRGRLQFGDHAVEASGELGEFIGAGQGDTVAQVAACNRVRTCHEPLHWRCHAAREHERDAHGRAQRQRHQKARRSEGRGGFGVGPADRHGEFGNRQRLNVVVEQVIDLRSEQREPAPFGLQAVPDGEHASRRDHHLLEKLLHLSRATALT